MRLPEQIGVIVFRRSEDYEFLLMKRIESRGGFWQFMTGRLEDFDRNKLDCAKRELNEELNLDINKIKRIIDNLPSFEFEHKENKIKEFIFGVEVGENAQIEIDHNEHEEYKWCTYDEAIKLLLFDNNKEALKNLYEKLK